MKRSQLEFRFVAYAIALSVLAGCADNALDPVNSAPKQNVTRLQPSQEKIRPEEKYLFDIEKEAPGFGGMYMDKDGYVHAFVTPDGNQSAVVEAVSRMFSSGRLPLSRGMRFAGVKIESGQYTIGELAVWRDQVSSALTSDAGLLPVALGLDEAHNRVKLVVEKSNDVQSAKSLGTQLRIADGALSVVVGERARESTTMVDPQTYITDQADKIVGGLGMAWTASGGGTSYLCTIAFTARKSGNSRFVTASHCSTNYFSVDGSKAYNSPYGSRQIGYETEDPSGYSCGVWPIVATCRGSDANIFTYSSGIVSEVGLIARLSGHSTLGWNSSVPYDTVSNVETNNMYVGLGIETIGMTDGWVSRNVTDTCDDVWYGTTIQKTCQTLASGSNSGGDSGGPVFWYTTSSRVTLAGLQHSHISSEIVFSPFQRIATNLGINSLSVVHQRFVPPTVSIVSGPGPGGGMPVGNQTWTASASGGNPSYTYTWERKEFCDVSFYWAGSGSSYEEYTTEETPSFWLRVTATDIYGNTSSEMRRIGGLVAC